MEADVTLSQGLGRSAMVPSSISALSSHKSCNLFSRTQQSSPRDMRQEKKNGAGVFHLSGTVSLVAPGDQAAFGR